MVVNLPGSGEVGSGSHVEEVPLGDHGPQQVLYICKEETRQCVLQVHSDECSSACDNHLPCGPNVACYP